MITSRNPGWHELATSVDVDVLDRRESITLLRRRAPDLTDEEAQRVAQARTWGRRAARRSRIRQQGGGHDKPNLWSNPTTKVGCLSCPAPNSVVE